MQKLRKISKKSFENDEKVKEVYFNYFSLLGMYYPRQSLEFQSPPWRADFHVEFGLPQYRRDAWQVVRDELKTVFPDALFKILDEYFGSNGPAVNFVNGFSDEELYRFCNMIKKSDRSTPKMREAAKDALQYR